MADLAGAIEAARDPQPQQLDAEGDADEQVTDSSRIWGAGVLLELVHIWRRVELTHPQFGRVVKARLVYDEFSEKVERAGNGNEGGGGGDSAIAKRSRKAVEDKLYTMKQMYRFIIEMNRDFGRQRNPRLGSNSYMRSWFDLTKQERRAVRSLHGIRIPNISQEVFQVLDSVLHADSATAKARKKAKGLLEQEAIEYQSLSLSLGSNDAGDDDQEDDDDDNDDGASTVENKVSAEFVLDGKRNWSADATMRLAKIWGDIQRASPNLRGAYLGDQVYSVFKAKAGGSLSRSQKAVEEKMQSMKEMYRFIKSYDATRGAIESGGNSGLQMKPSWFELTKTERRQVRKANKIRVTNLSREQFDQVDAIMSVRAEAEAALLEITVQTTSAAAPSNNSTSAVQTHQETQQARHESIASDNYTQSSAVLDAMQRIIAQELRAGSSIARDNQAQQAPGTQAALKTTTTTRAQKRPRADGLSSAPHVTRSPALPSTTRSGAKGIDHATAAYLLEKVRVLHEEDRTERRRQHAEHMAAIRELAALLKNQQQLQSSAVAREAATEGL